MVTRRGERGSALIWVLGFIVVLGIVISASQALARMAERQMYARNSISRTELAAASAVEVLTDRLRGAAATRMGNISWGDLLAINLGATSLQSELRTTGADVRFQFDTLATGVRIVDIRDGEVIPHDERVLAAWAQQPRVSWDALPDVGGSVAARTVEVEVYATAYGPREGRRMVTRRVAISTVSPFQNALYIQGDAEMVTTGAPGLVGGPMRVDGTANFLRGGALMWYVGGVEARDGIVVSGTGQHVVGGTTYGGTTPALSTLTRFDQENLADGFLAPWQGRVRIRPGLGGFLSPGRMQSASVAGSGECPDLSLACGGRGSFLPSVTLRRVHAGSDSTFSVSCGSAWDGDPCAAAVSGVKYVPYPFATNVGAGYAQRDPGIPGRIWRGLYPDFRLQSPCDASPLIGQPNGTYRTFRCPGNPYGFLIDVGALPEIPGGVLALRRATNQVHARPSGASEVVVLRNAAALRGPLTIVSEMPVVIWGDFNTTPATVGGTVMPAMIQAPRITVMPNETEAQLAESSHWDLARAEGEPATATPVVYPVQARRDVNIYAVLRSGFCRGYPSAYYGGSWEGLPATFGDWSRAGLRVIGAVEGYDETALGASVCGSYWAPLNGAQPGGVASEPPAHRSVLFNRRLLVPQGQPPGSWYPDNLPLYGALPGAPTRTRTRQENAMGGVGVMRLIQDLRAIPPAARGSTLRPTVRTTAGMIALPPLPPAL